MHDLFQRVRAPRDFRDGPESKAYIGGLSVVEVASREEALEWAAKIAVACRCAQEVREFGPGSRVREFVPDATV